MVYVAEGNTTGEEILRNEHGSVRYLRFLSHLGTLVRLKGCELYTGGLDKEENLDGEVSFYWQDDITEGTMHVCVRERERARAWCV